MGFESGQEAFPRIGSLLASAIQPLKQQLNTDFVEERQP